MDYSFWNGKRVFITGHTGFKGSWLCMILALAGAKVTGYALEPNTEPSLFYISNIASEMRSCNGDIRDFEYLKRVFNETTPEIVFHLAAQPIVRTSYKNPRYTYETNVMGTVNLLECVRTSTNAPRSVLNITTDKVYLNREWEWGYREDEPLDGFDPYSNSKSCSELVTHSYRNSFFASKETTISTARAGNVIGGGDFAKDRIIPDCVRAVSKNEPIIVRNPYSTRPYQHVFEPLNAYLMIAQRQYENKLYEGYYNVGPDDCDCVSTVDLVKMFCEKWGDGVTFENKTDVGPHEANFLKLDCSRLKRVFGWKPWWNVETAVAKTIEWSKAYYSGKDMSSFTQGQIEEYFMR